MIIFIITMVIKTANVTRIDNYLPLQQLSFCAFHCHDTRHNIFLDNNCENKYDVCIIKMVTMITKMTLIDN